MRGYMMGYFSREPLVVVVHATDAEFAGIEAATRGMVEWRGPTSLTYPSRGQTLREKWFYADRAAVHALLDFGLPVNINDRQLLDWLVGTPQEQASQGQVDVHATIMVYLSMKQPKPDYDPSDPVIGAITRELPAFTPINRYEVYGHRQTGVLRCVKPAR